MTKVKFTRGEKVYETGDPINCVYIVKKGEFELLKKLPKYKNDPEEVGLNKDHVLATKLTELKDFPHWQRLNILEPGTLVGEDDLLVRGTRSCTLKCYSGEGQLFKLDKDVFNQLRREESWNKVLKKIAYKECRQDALDITDVQPESVIHNLRWDQINLDSEKNVRDPLLYSLIPHKILTQRKRKPIEFKLNKYGNPIFKWRENHPPKNPFTSFDVTKPVKLE